MTNLKYKDEDLIGKRFGKLTVLELFRKRIPCGELHRFAHCKCDCGNYKDVFIGSLLDGQTTSCGCTWKICEDKDLIGKRFGKLTILEIVRKRNKNGHLQKIARCICDCGKEKDILIYDILKNKTMSCGCYNVETTIQCSTTHGLKGHPLYKVWCNIKGRCENPNVPGYVNYGGRGIKICEEWRNSAGEFINWCIDNGWRKDLSIDRINNDGNYEPSNCRFTGRHIQAVNQRLSSRNKSGYKGVYQAKNSNMWQSYIRVNRHQYHLGSFKSKLLALEARNRFIIENGLTEYKIQEWKGE